MGHPSHPGKNNEVKKVVIEDGVTYIGNNAFADFKALREIVIPATVTATGVNIFDNPQIVTVYGYSGTYAEDNSMVFVSLGDAPENNAPETFFEKIRAFFDKIIQWFRNLFNRG